jgi:NAD(P)-dependent dehydrogenase (short-subunit alcohol dehydrogenase family)
MARLQGRRIIITGGASGIGRATVELFRQEGAAVAVLDRTASPDDAPSFEVDVSDAASVKQAVDAAAKTMGGLDGLVNAAGIFSAAGLADTSPDLFSKMLAVNLTGTFLVIQAAAPHLTASGGGTIVNLASGVGLTPTGPGSVAYVASKGGVIALTKVVAMELAPAIRVNAVCPGAVDTPMTQSFLRDASGTVDPSIARRYALRRAAAPDELATSILFLTSNEASFVTGIALPVDGGRTFH